MVRALQTAQTQSVREIKKNADIKKTNKKISTFVVVFLVVLIIGFIAYKAYAYYQSTKFDFKETEKGINFYSKDLAVKDAISVILDSNDILLSTNTVVTSENTENPIVEPMVLATTVLVFKDKNVVNVDNIVDSNYTIINCATDQGPENKVIDLNGPDCQNIIDSITPKIIINTPNPNLKESRVEIYPIEKTIIFYSKSSNDLLISTYLLLKSNYSDIDEILQRVEFIKKKISTIIPKENTIDTNATQSDTNQIDPNA